MNTTQISISTELYNYAADYARSHHTSVEKMTESFFLTLMVVGQKDFLGDGRKEDEASRQEKLTRERLDDIAKGKGEKGLKSLKGIMASSKMTAEELREEYISDKYSV